MEPNSEEKRLAWKYPGCDHLRERGYRRIDWLSVRSRLGELSYPSNMEIIFEALANMSGASTEYDEEARICQMGIPAVFFYLTRYSLDMARQVDGQWEPEDLRKAVLQYSVLENYISCLDPGLIDRANWTFTNDEVMSLRRQILRAYRRLEASSAPSALTGSAPLIRVYVYDQEEVPELAPLLQSQIYCSRGQWGTDVHMHDFFVTSSCYTEDPAQADFFFVPGYAICMLESNIHTLDEIDQLYKDLIRALPYFNASAGKDHVFVFGSGMAHSVFQSWRQHIAQAIVLTPETELFNDFAWITDPPFQTWKDIVIPGSLDLAEVIGLLEASKPLHERRRLAAFFGRIDTATRGPHPWVGGVDVRQEVWKLLELPDVGDDLSFGGGASHEVMHAALGDARFCFAPRGKSGWSLRFFEVVFAGCVPVVISDRWELPFEDFLDVAKFVIKWPSARLAAPGGGAELLSYLRSLPDEVVQQYMDEAAKVRCWYFYPPKRLDVRGSLRRQHHVCPEENGHDAFQGVLRVLGTRTRRSRTSSSSFYFRDPSHGGRPRHVGQDLRAWR